MFLICWGFQHHVTCNSKQCSALSDCILESAWSSVFGILIYLFLFLIILFSLGRSLIVSIWKTWMHKSHICLQDIWVITFTSIHKFRRYSGQLFVLTGAHLPSVLLLLILLCVVKHEHYNKQCHALIYPWITALRYLNPGLNLVQILTCYECANLSHFKTQSRHFVTIHFAFKLNQQ